MLSQWNSSFVSTVRNVLNDISGRQVLTWTHLWMITINVKTIEKYSHWSSEESIPSGSLVFSLLLRIFLPFAFGFNCFNLIAMFFRTGWEFDPPGASLSHSSSRSGN